MRTDDIGMTGEFDRFDKKGEQRDHGEEFCRSPAEHQIIEIVAGFQRVYALRQKTFRADELEGVTLPVLRLRIGGSHNPHLKFRR